MPEESIVPTIFFFFKNQNKPLISLLRKLSLIRGGPSIFFQEVLADVDALLGVPDERKSGFRL